MRILSKYLENPFDAGGISVTELTRFTADHLPRLAGNNPGGIFSARIAATTTALAAVEAGSTDDQVKTAIRKALVEAKNNFRRDLPIDIQKIYGICVGHFGPNGTQITQIFPEGRGIFNSCKDDDLNNKLGVVVAGVTAHQATLGAPLVAQATAVQTNWVSVYEASKTAVGQRATTQEAKNAARAVLQLELFWNLLEIAKAFPRQPEKLALYMQQHFLENDVTEEEEEPPTPPGE